MLNILSPTLAKGAVNLAPCNPLVGQFFLAYAQAGSQVHWTYALHTKNSKVYLINKGLQPLNPILIFYNEVAPIHHTTKTSSQKIELIYYA